MCNGTSQWNEVERSQESQVKIHETKAATHDGLLTFFHFRFSTFDSPLSV